jgi:L-serine/L-threonine ammonia-lyase
MYCPPFDHQDVIDGNASMIYEIVEQMNGVVPDAIVCCVGGGGLIGGILKGASISLVEPEIRFENGKASGMERWFLDWWDVELISVAVVAVETTGAGSFHAAHVAGKLVGIPEITSIAKSLGAKKISRLTFDLAQQHGGPVQSVLVSDVQAANATWRFASRTIEIPELTRVDDQRIMVEVAGGATLSLVYEGLVKDAVPNLTENSTVVLIVCGGSTPWKLSV